MRNLRRFDTVAELNAAIANSTIDMIGLAFENGKPVIRKKEVTVGPNFNGHDYVDLGAVINGHKVYFATKNVGAATIYDYGNYYAWGELTPNKTGNECYWWTDYSMNPSGDGQTMTKYNETDGKTVLDLTDDVAHAVMGGDWRMPTFDELQFLNITLENNRQIVTNYQDSNVNGALWTANNQTLFIPAGSGWEYGKMYPSDTTWYIWSASNGMVNPREDATITEGWVLMSNPTVVAQIAPLHRYFGATVRGVITGEAVS
jgi:hypothetical protein